MTGLGQSILQPSLILTEISGCLYIMYLYDSIHWTLYRTSTEGLYDI